MLKDSRPDASVGPSSKNGGNVSSGQGNVVEDAENGEKFRLTPVRILEVSCRDEGLNVYCEVVSSASPSLPSSTADFLTS